VLLDRAARRLHADLGAERAVVVLERRPDGVHARQRAQLGVHEVASLEVEDGIRTRRAVHGQARDLPARAVDLQQVGQRHLVQVPLEHHGCPSLGAGPFRPAPAHVPDRP
jgi:hypothetical protein